jgi:8-oxo-dGTP pyrophosphatase MutT (NUDIX family)
MTLRHSYTAERIRAALSRTPRQDDDALWPAGASQEIVERLRALIPAVHVPAAVLVALVERDTGLNVILTERAATLRDHAGQVSFPGGRIEPSDLDAWMAALRETEEEIGLNRSHVEFAGYMPDHLVISGFRVTPVVGFVRPEFTLAIDQAEVQEVFEVPLSHIFDIGNHRPRRRKVGDMEIEVADIPYGQRNIWGATAGMLLTLRRLIHDATDSSAR